MIIPLVMIITWMRWRQQNEQKRSSGEDSSSWFWGTARAFYPLLQCFIVGRPVFFADGQGARSGVCSIFYAATRMTQSHNGRTFRWVQMHSTQAQLVRVADNCLSPIFKIMDLGRAFRESETFLNRTAKILLTSTKLKFDQRNSQPN
jgi:hypothetical protein